MNRQQKIWLITSIISFVLSTLIFFFTPNFFSFIITAFPFLILGLASINNIFIPDLCSQCNKPLDKPLNEYENETFNPKLCHNCNIQELRNGYKILKRDDLINETKR